MTMEGPERSAADLHESRSRTISPALLEPQLRRSMSALAPSGEAADGTIVADDRGRMRVIIELNIMHERGLEGAKEDLRALFAVAFGRRNPRTQRMQSAPSSLGLTEVTKSYMRANLTQDQIIALADANEEVTRRRRSGTPQEPDWPADRPIYHIWPDFRVSALIDRSVSTIKADAARRSFSASGREIVWAVLDSGIQADHPHFQKHDTLGGSVARLHRDFTLDADAFPNGVVPDDESIASALRDEGGHGTHVAGIIAGALDESYFPDLRVHKRVRAGDELSFTSQLETTEERRIAEEDKERFTGVAPHTKLISLKVLDENGNGDASSVMRALAYIRENLNDDPKLLRVHGVNLSLGYPFNARWFACGQSPICVEVDRLVKSGVVVVVSAGNSGYGSIAAETGKFSTGLSLSINDPGNAALAITVGATHRDSPHTYGVSYFSSKGPTGDGRLKPDLVAPGETITSAAAGKVLAKMLPDAPTTTPAYSDLSGTSMAAPHVSGAIAAFLSIRREFIGRPEDVKRIFLNSATSLGREPYFQGHGLLDLMRAIQSV